mmetsp:Transcript_83169/g.239013  ORF Transcript_83169/g.239013 Transcript_83169/m.239013 type:complete len:749 (-) Transcript_83169:115-2361(-)
MTSIDFRPAGVFSSPLFSTQRSARRASNAAEASVALFVPQRNFLFLGLTDGKICCWETDKSATPPRGKDTAPTRVLDEHRGGIRCMIFVEDLCQGIMFTGSADRCIKMWDLSDPRISIPCVHSLHGHGGTVLALEYGSEMLLSSSSDGFLCIWKDQSPTKLLRFPAYSIRQKISPDPRAGPQGSRQPRESWFLSIAIRDGEVPSIFAGDSEGYVHIYKPDSGSEGENQLFLLAWKKQIHELGISKILTVPMESFLITLAYDQKFKTLDSLSGQVVFEEFNQCGVIFNGLAWDPVCQDVVVADEKGNIGFYNLYTETCVVWKTISEEPIIQIHYEPAARRLLLLSAHVLRVFDVVRGVKFSELNEHEGPIVSMASRPTPQGCLLYTASMDNTIRLWDADTLESIKCLKEKKYEITAMLYLPRANVIITGHENSDLKMWSVDCAVEASLRTISGQGAHTNTISALASALVFPNLDDPAMGSNMGGTNRDKGSDGWETIIAGSYDRQLSFWKVTLTSDGSAMAKFERAFLAHDQPDDEVLAVAYSSVADAVFTGGNSGIIRKWASSGNKKLKAEFEGHEDAVTCFAVDANFLFSGSVDCSVCIWETSQGYQLKSVQMHNVAVQAVLVVPDSGHVVTCAFDGRLVVWDPQIGRPDVREVAVYEQPEEFRALAYVDMSRTILVGSETGRIITFPLPADTGSPSGGGTGNGGLGGPHGFSAAPKAVSGVATPPSEDEDDRGMLEALNVAAARSM